MNKDISKEQHENNLKLIEALIPKTDNTIIININVLADLTNKMYQIQNVFDCLDLTRLKPINHVFHPRYEVQKFKGSDLSVRLLKDNYNVMVYIEADELSAINDQVVWINKNFGNMKCCIHTDIDLQLGNCKFFITRSCTLRNQEAFENIIHFGSDETPSWPSVISTIISSESYNGPKK